MNTRNARLIARIDCTREYPADQYFAYGEVKVVDGPAGRYREADGKQFSRFGYRFRIENIGRPHVMGVRYPDDKRRFMFAIDGTCYDLSTAIVTGFAHPLSGQMLELKNIFWPRSEDCSITFMTWGHGEAAAAASFEVYELDDLAPLEVPGDPGDGTRRELGVQYEDPCGTGASEGAMNISEWTDHIVAYMRHSGQKLLGYPICWYHGPQYPSQREPADAFGVVVARDRRQYATWTTQPPEWVAPLLDRFAREGLEFQAVLTLLRLGSLMQKMNTDLDAIKAGAETINNMLSNDQVQAGTMDWTTLYNARNYEKVLDYPGQHKDWSGFAWQYGEKAGQPYHAGPIFNPLHPVVQEAIVGFVREIAERYGKHPAFKGVAFTMWTPSLLWFGSLHSGYDDYTIDRFEKETGIRVEVEKTAPDRFSKRYEFLTFACREAWLDWRCRKIAELVRTIRDTLRAVRPDLRVTLNMWREAFVTGIIWHGDVRHQLYACPGLVALCRQAGIDVALYQDEPGIQLDLEFDGGNRDRMGWVTDTSELPIEKFTVIRDHDFLDEEMLATFGGLANSGAYIFNAWHEAWGEHKWFRCEPDDAQAKELAFMHGKPAEGIFRLNSLYPKDGFWWDSQLRITPAFPAGPHFMEQYAHAVAELDALRITRGGLFMEKAHTGEIATFAKAYRALPKVKFETVGRTTDPVAVRSVAADGRRYFYLMNRDYYPIEVKLTFDRAAGTVTELATGKAKKVGKTWDVTAGPYELRSFTVAEAVRLTAFEVTVPTEITEALRGEAETALGAMAEARSGGRHIAGLDRMEQRIRDAMAEGRPAFLRRALTGYIVRKCRESAESR